MSDLNQISKQAFVQQIASWELTLQRQAKKLRQLRSSNVGRLQLNTIEITLVVIESELIQYKKTKQIITNPKPNNKNIPLLPTYTALSKSFMAALQKVAEATDHQKYRTNTHANSPQPSEENNCPNKNHYLASTFNSRVAQEPSKRKRKQSVQIKKEVNSTKSRVLRNSAIGGARVLPSEEEEDLSDVRYQLKEIKSMMVQISNEVKFHQHEELDRQLSKIGHSNKQLKTEVKLLKEDNQLILARLQTISKAEAIQKRIFPMKERHKPT